MQVEGWPPENIEDLARKADDQQFKGLMRGRP
jgi:hypothetical protein